MTTRFLATMVAIAVLSMPSTAQFWQNTEGPPAATSCLASNSKGMVFAGTAFSAVYRSTDLGTTWVRFDNGIAQDPSRRCSVSTTTNCSNPPIPDSDRELLNNIDIVKYVSAGLFWGVYAYGVADSLVHYVPRIETEITPGKAAVKLSWDF